jgi:hypothetical protein
MKATVYNPQQGRLETLEVELTDENTTWFQNRGSATQTVPLATITDFNGGLLIQALDYSYPIWLYDISRADINYSQKKAKQLLPQYQ